MEPTCRMPTMSFGCAGATPGPTSSALTSVATMARAFMTCPPGSMSSLSLEHAAEAARRGVAPHAAPGREHGEAQHVGQHVEHERRDRHAARLQLQLERDGPAEEKGAGDGAQRLPAREDDERDRDEAAARR